MRKLYEMRLSGLQEKVRDLFLIGCYTSLRYDQFSKIEKGCISHTAKGNHVIRIKQGKVNKMVVIPILNEELITLLEKYDYTVPKISSQKMNENLKVICKELSNHLPSLRILERTRLTKLEREDEEAGKVKFKYDDRGYPIKHRWELISCHTARRTCLTNMYLSRKFTNLQMMSVSGHKKEETFLKYIRLSLDEKADDVANAAADGIF